MPCIPFFVDSHHIEDYGYETGNKQVNIASLAQLLFPDMS